MKTTSTPLALRRAKRRFDSDHLYHIFEYYHSSESHVTLSKYEEQLRARVHKVWNQHIKYHMIIEPPNGIAFKDLTSAILIFEGRSLQRRRRILIKKLERAMGDIANKKQLSLLQNRHQNLSDLINKYDK